MSCWALIPFKGFDRGKSRLSERTAGFKRTRSRWREGALRSRR